LTATTFLEPGQVVRWRGARWRVLGEEGAFLRLAGLEHGMRDTEVTPLLSLEAEAIEPDELPLPAFEPEKSDRALWRALHQAYLTTMVGGREHLVGLDWGAVAVEPYQLVPLLRVARTMRARLLIADDTGLGKTAEAGIVLRWLAQRHRAGRVLILTRAAPEPGRWKSEMWTKFGFRFEILRDGAEFNEWRRRNPTVNVFAQEQKLIVSMTLAARQALLDELRQCPFPFDVIIVDEAAHLAVRGNRRKRLAMLGTALARASKDGALLLLTATPHDGKTESFLSLLKLLDPLIEVQLGTVPVDLASRLIVRRLKSEVTLAGGRKFLEPKIHVISTLRFAGKEERGLDEPLDRYLEWLAKQQSMHKHAGARQKATGCQFLAGIYRKRFGSSVAALRATLRRRLGVEAAPEDSDAAVPYVQDNASDPEDEIIDPGLESETPPPPLVPKEEELARALLEAAERVPRGRDSKLQAIVELLAGDITAKVVVFTECRDTLRAAARRLADEGIEFVLFHGGTPDAQREDAIHRFIHDPGVRVFLATDAASEGINLQRAAANLVHLDVPWNPNRYVQRNGRIDRYGQDHQPHIWALVAADVSKKQGRPEARALEVIIDKLQKIAAELGSAGLVFPGFTGATVRELLQQANEESVTQIEALDKAPEIDGNPDQHQWPLVGRPGDVL
jgi:superfamily II DNA or RNA helicase